MKKKLFCYCLLITLFVSSFSTVSANNNLITIEEFTEAQEEKENDSNNSSPIKNSFPSLDELESNADNNSSPVKNPFPSLDELESNTVNDTELDKISNMLIPSVGVDLKEQAAKVLSAGTGVKPGTQEWAILQEYDKDGDGKLSESEQKAVTSAMQNGTLTQDEVDKLGSQISISDQRQQAARSKQKLEDGLKELYPGESELSIQVKVNTISDIVIACESFGLTREAIAGICANIYCESGFFPYAVQGEYSLNADLVFDKNATVPILKVNGRDVAYLDGSIMQQARAQRTYTASSTITMPNLYDVGGSYGEAGIGLIQSTDCGIDKENPTERHLMNGLRASQLYNVGMSNSNDAFTCIYSFSNEFTYASPDDGNWNSSGKITPKNSSYLFIPSTPIQMGVLCCSLDEFGHASKVNDYEYKKGSEGYNGWLSSEMTWEDFCNLTDPWYAAEAFCKYCERNDGGWEVRLTKSKDGMAKVMEIVCDQSIVFGSTTTVSTLGTEAEKLSYMTDLATSGFYTEDQLAHYVSMTETNIDMKLLSNAMRENLTSQELSELADWERNIETNSLEYIIIDGGRKILMVFAIALEVWSLLVYLAYWFDRLNNFIPISFLTILTFGKLRIADDTTKATYSLRENSTKTSVKTVNHRAVLYIVVLGLSLGTLIITGYIYIFIEWLVMKAHNFFN